MNIYTISGKFEGSNEDVVVANVAEKNLSQMIEYIEDFKVKILLIEKEVSYESS